MNKHISVLILNVLRDSLLQVAPESIKPTEPKGVTRVNKVFGPLTHVAFSLALAASAILLAGAQASAQCPATPLTSGLQIPLGISQSNEGNLLVSETGTSTPNTGRISIVGLNGTRRTLLDGLPSGLNDVNEPSGPAGLFMRGRTLYVAVGIGDSFLPGTIVPNPNPSSPLFSTVLAVHFSADIEKTTDGFTLSPSDQQALAHGQKLTLSTDGRDHVTVELVADFPNLNTRPDLPFWIPRLEPLRLGRCRQPTLRHGRRSELGLACRHSHRSVLDARGLPSNPKPAAVRPARARCGPDRHHVFQRPVACDTVPRLSVPPGDVDRQAGRSVDGRTSGVYHWPVVGYRRALLEG